MSNTSMNTEYGFHRTGGGDLRNLREYLNEDFGAAPIVNAGDSLVAGGLIFPVDDSLIPLGPQNTPVPQGTTIFKVDTGIDGGELLYLWEPSGTLPAQPFTITNVVSNSFSGYDFTIDGSDYEFVTRETLDLRVLRRPVGFGADVSGATSSQASIDYMATSSVVIDMEEDDDLLLSTLPSNISWVKNGSITWDTGEGTTITMNDGFQTDRTKFFSIEKNGPIFTAPKSFWTKNFFGTKTTSTDTGRYNTMTFQDSNDMKMSGLTAFGVGPRWLGCQDLSLNQFYIDVNNAGIGPVGSDAGTDGLKMSRKTTFNVSNGVILNPSRDGLDAFTSGKEFNFTDVRIYNFNFIGIDLKFIPGDEMDNDDTHHEINIDNIQFHGGGAGADINERFSVISIFNNEDPKSLTTSPRKINISNVIMKNVFNNVTNPAICSGITLIGCYEVAMTNVNTGLITGDSGVGQQYFGAFISRCDTVKAVDCIFNGKDRGWSQSNSNNIDLTGCDIGFSLGQTNTIQGLGFSGENKDFTMNGGRVRGSTNLINSQELTNPALTGASFCNVGMDGGQIRVDTFNKLTFESCDIVSNETTIDAIFSSGSTPAEKLSIIGGTITGGRSCVNVQSMTRPKIIGLSMLGYASTSAIRGTTDGSTIISLCTVEGAGTLPTPTGNDFIDNNILNA